MRRTIAAAFAGVFAALGLACAGCGGGGTTDPAASPTQVQGKVLSVNGASLALDGVTVECVNDGTVVVTAADGSFRLDVPAGEILRVRFGPGRGAPPVVGILPGGCVETGDPTQDDGDLDDDVVEVEPLEDGEVCGLEVELADGRVVECDVDHPSPGGPRFYGEGVLVPVRPDGDRSALGEVEVRVEGECAALEVEAVRLLSGATYEVVLVSPDLKQVVLGAMTADRLGAAHLSVEACAGDPLPSGVLHLVDLAGYGVLVEDEAGVPILVGQVPGRGPEFGEPGHEPPHPGLPGGDGPFPGDGRLPPIGTPPDGTLPPLPGADDLLDLLDDLLGGNPFAGGLPGVTR